MILLQLLDTMFTYGFKTAHTAALHSIYDGNFLSTLRERTIKLSSISAQISQILQIRHTDKL